MSETPSPPSTHSSNTEASTYIDTNADVTLTSEDGRVFKVHSYVLKAHR